MVYYFDRRKDQTRPLKSLGNTAFNFFCGRKCEPTLEDGKAFEMSVTDFVHENDMCTKL